MNSLNIDFTNMSFHSERSKEILKIDKILPQIYLPKDKQPMFDKWWDEDIRFQSGIPHTFNEGYFKCELDTKGFYDHNSDKARAMIRQYAKSKNLSYYEVRDKYDEFFGNIRYMTLYFKFLEENRVLVKIYDTQLKLATQITLKLGNGVNPTMLEMQNENLVEGNIFTDTVSDILCRYYLQVIAYWTTSMWYIATTTSTTKYIYEKDNYKSIPNKNKHIIDVQDYKVIKTPIYDMSKIRVVKVDRLIAHRKGWTYSHSFQVHGHYRHYKNGRVIFVESYIKAKGKEFKQQNIVIKPKE